MIKIEIGIEPEKIGNSLMYAWRVIKDKTVTGHGWSKSIEQAAADAKEYVTNK